MDVMGGGNMGLDVFVFIVPFRSCTACIVEKLIH